MPTEAQRNADFQFNEEAATALMEWQAQHWELTVSEKAAFLSGYVAGVSHERPDFEGAFRNAVRLR